MSTPKALISTSLKIESILKTGNSDAYVRAEIDKLAASPDDFVNFRSALMLWAPNLYARNPAYFRCTLLCFWKASGTWATRLEKWLAEVEAAEDWELLVRLLMWKRRSERSHRFFSEKFISLFQSSPTQTRRIALMRLFTPVPFHFTEDQAMMIYSVEPTASRAFLLKHLPQNAGLYRDFHNLLGDSHDAAPFFRHMASATEWTREVNSLLARTYPPTLAELEAIFPDNAPSKDLQATLLRLAQTPATLPFALVKLPHFREKRQQMNHAVLDHARNVKCYPLWGELVASHRGAVSEIGNLLNSRLDSETIDKFLNAYVNSNHKTYPGIQFGLRVSDSESLMFLERFPQFFKRRRLQYGYNTRFDRLVKAALAQNDPQLIDTLASHLVEVAARSHVAEAIQLLLNHYEKLDPRAPASIARLHFILHTATALAHGRDHRFKNPLADFMVKWNLTAMPPDQSVGSQVPQIRRAAIELLVQENSQFRLNATHREWLIGDLLGNSRGNIERKFTFQILAKIPDDDSSAHAILEVARQALRLDAPGYPKNELILLVATLLKRWPNLQSSRERKIIYES